MSITPANEKHAYGYGKAESLAGIIAAIALLGAAAAIAIQSVREIWTPHHLPHWSTLVVLLLVVAIKESLAGCVVYACRMRHDPALAAAVKRIDGVRVLNQFGDELRIIADESVDEGVLAAALRHKLAPGDRLRAVAPTIEDAFITLTLGGEPS